MPDLSLERNTTTTMRHLLPRHVTPQSAIQPQLFEDPRHPELHLDRDVGEAIRLLAGRAV